MLGGRVGGREGGREGEMDGEGKKGWEQERMREGASESE